MPIIANVIIEQEFGDKRALTHQVRVRNRNQDFLELAEQALQEDGCTKVTLVSLNCVINLRKPLTT